MYDRARPFVSKAMAVRPEQAAEANEGLRRDGNSGGEYLMQERVINGRRLPPGTFIAESQGARNAELKRRGYVDFDGGWGDHTGNSR